MLQRKDFLNKLNELIETAKQAYDYGLAEGQRLLERWKREAQDRAEVNGAILSNVKEVKNKEQNECNHLKGGLVDLNKEPHWPNQGKRNDYAIIKHQFFWGDIWIICLRCNKKWKPNDLDYNKMLNAYTMNQMSSSIQFHGQGLKEACQEATKDS